MDKIKGVLLDIDGVLYTGDKPVPGASDAIGFLEDSKIPFRCISNTTRKSKKSISEKLESYGFDIPAGHIFTPASVVVSILKENNVKNCFLLTWGDVRQDILKDGITENISDAGVVIVGDAGDNFDYSSMNQAFRLINEGAEFYALEKDRYWMDSDGLSLSAGPFVLGLEYATGRSAILVGKPSPSFFTKALESMNVKAPDAIMIGDDINSDVGGAQNIGVRGILVRTGKFSEEKLKKSEIIPYRIIDSIGDLPEIIGNSN
ncbi:TIGR01458 family HAD-type hydrolase [Methanolacinia paynteri]|uniref:TIGR01458 family HAD-type hydrolase n=1 Tax=Methanolacinia paynteri TaxID=230356 RepID=UPI00064E68A4|nr:TIGR01458 family HAD-type hydrolase [Methanolacinia paynteri]